MVNKEFWTDRYSNEETQWDIGYASPALMAYMEDKPLDAKILIPGAGNAYEAEALWKLGFKNITVLDIAEQPLAQLKARVPDFPEKKLVCADFFEFEGQFDIILEQTFFCAIKPNLRLAYVKKMSDLLKRNGELAGLLFNGVMKTDEPPYGGNRKVYLPLFSTHLELIEIDTCKVSIKPRAGKELFFIAKLKN